MLGIGRFVLRRWFVLLAVFAVTLAAAGAAWAAGADVNPGTQSVLSGQTVKWTGSWGNVPPYSIKFYYGDGNVASYQGPDNYGKFQDAFYTCTGQTFYQHLHVQDNTGETADAYASTFVAKGNIC